MMMKQTTQAFALAALAAGFFLSSTSLADTTQPESAQPLKRMAMPRAVAEVIVLHGTNGDGGIDPSIGKLPQLKQPPFSAYKSYKLLKRSKMGLRSHGAASLELPDKGRFQLELKEVKAGKSGKSRYVLQARIDKAGGKKFLPAMKVNANSGDIFFIAGQKYDGGILVLGIRVLPKK